MTTARTLPHSIEAEMSVIGGILLQPKALDEVLEQLAAVDFYDPTHAALFDAMLALDRDGKPIDVVSLGEHMKAAGTWDRLRGKGHEAYLSRLMDGVITVENLGYHAKIVADCAARRLVIEKSHEAIGIAYAGEDGWRDVIETEVMAAVEPRKITSQKTAATVIKRVYDAIYARASAPSTDARAIVGLRTGLRAIDELTLGLRDGRLYVMAGRPGDGKTALGLQLATHVTQREGAAVLGFSLEMGAEEWGLRQFAAEARVDATSLELAALEHDEWRAIDQAMARLQRAPFVYDDQPSITMRQVRARARRWRAATQGKRGMILLDYVQLVDAEQVRGENEATALGRVSRGLKSLAKELAVPVLALAQLNRDSERESAREPQLRDLRGSGSIEQDADAVAFLYAREKKPDDQPTRLIFRKLRGGKVGEAALVFHKREQRFSDDDGSVAPLLDRASRTNGTTRHPNAPDDYQEDYR